MPMNQEIKNRWVAWLRANVDKQTRGRLNRIATIDPKNTPVGFCCLGGLCELAVADGVITSWSHLEHGDSLLTYGNSDGSWSDAVLPQSVVDWAGLEEDDPEVNVPGDDATEPTRTGLTYVNDELRYNFNQIADLIDAQL